MQRNVILVVRRRAFLVIQVVRVRGADPHAARYAWRRPERAQPDGPPPLLPQPGQEQGQVERRRDIQRLDDGGMPPFPACTTHCSPRHTRRTRQQGIAAATGLRASLRARRLRRHLNYVSRRQIVHPISPGFRQLRLSSQPLAAPGAGLLQGPSRWSAGGHHQTWRPFPTRLPHAARPPDRSAPGNLPVTGRARRVLGMRDRKAEWTCIPPSVPLRRWTQPKPGAGWAEDGALRPPWPFRRDSGTQCLVRVGAHITEGRQPRTSHTVCSYRGE